MKSDCDKKDEKFLRGSQFSKKEKKIFTLTELLGIFHTIENKE